MLISRLPLETCEPATSPGTDLPCRTAAGGRLAIHAWLASVLLLEVAGVAAGTHAMHLGTRLSAPGTVQAWASMAGAVALWLLAARSQSLYDGASMLSGRPMLLRAAWAATITFGIVLLVAAGWRNEATPGVAAWRNEATPGLGWQTSCALCAGGMMLAVRGVWSAWLRAALRAGRHVERALLVAETPLAARWAAAQWERSTGGSICIIASTAVSEAGAHAAMRLPHGICAIEAIEAAVREGRLDRVLIVGADHGGALLGAASEALVARLARLAIDVTLIPGPRALALGARPTRQLSGIACIDLVSRPYPKVMAAVKRAEDVVLASVILLAAAPAILAAAMLIRLESPGPVLFRQRRVGFHDQVFRVWKFRTMYAHLTDEAAAVQTARRDTRVTRVGRLLRRTSLDELPQFFNVLSGEMSVVGPRPHAEGMTVAGHRMGDLLDAYSTRHRIKPGITGWAQINGCRGAVDSEQKLARRLALDCYYIANWSIALDLYVIARTAALLAFDTQAY